MFYCNNICSYSIDWLMKHKYVCLIDIKVSLFEFETFPQRYLSTEVLQKYAMTDVTKNILTDCNYAYDPYLREL